MGRRRVAKNARAEPPADWRECRPGIDALYWKFGGPFIPPERIEPSEEQRRNNRPEWVGQHLKSPHHKLAHAEAELARCEKELAEATAYYLTLNEQGIDGLWFEYQREQDRETDAREQTAREMSLDDGWQRVPRNIDMHRASSFGQIGLFKARIAACQVAIERLDRPAHPLLYLGGKK